MKVLLVCPTLSQNALGRAFSLWLLVRELGGEAQVVGPSEGFLWPPLADTTFANDCIQFSHEQWNVASLRRLATRVDMLIAVKALPQSFGVVKRLASRVGTRWLLDVDDPDLEALRTSLSRRQRLGLVHPSTTWRGEHPYQLRQMARELSRSHLSVSNPVLQSHYGTGALVPHVRAVPSIAVVRSSRELRIAFIGTPRHHKGLHLLRLCVSQLQSKYRVRLLVTASKPTGSAEYEIWTGPLPFSESMDLLRSADVVAIPSLDDPFADLQLPVKLIDGMMAGKTVVASDLKPIRWALGGTGLLFPPGSVQRLTERLQDAADPAVRKRLGASARTRALAMFSPQAVAPTFGRLLERVIQAG